jgi:hypothetical protein
MQERTGSARRNVATRQVPEWVNLVDPALSAICPVSRQSWKCPFGVVGVCVDVILAPQNEVATLPIIKRGKYSSIH